MSCLPTIAKFNRGNMNQFQLAELEHLIQDETGQQKSAKH